MADQKKVTTTIEISHRTIFSTLVLLLGLVVVYMLRDLVVGLFISILVATALNPTITRLERLKVPRAAAILFIYLIILSLVVLLISTLVPPLIVQTSNLLNTLPLNGLTDNLRGVEVSLENLQYISSQLGSVVPILKVIGSTFSGLVTLFTFAVITFYLLLERKNLHKYLMVLLPKANAEKKAEELVDAIEKQIGGWVRGELILMFVVGSITYIGLTLLGIPYALPLAILAGLLEIVPNIGPTISAVPATLAPLLTGQNPILSVFVIALYILVQQLENNIIVPKVMQSAVGVHPLVTIVLIIIGLKLAGISGAILAVPLFLVIKVFYTQLIKPYYQHTPGS